jgi:glycosyltransferase involved in cell wall biosynthesis
MKIALIRREYITHLDGVNRFIALLAEGLVKLGHEPIIASWCWYGTQREILPKWFREIHGLDVEIPIYTLKTSPCSGDPWLRIAWDWLTEGSKLLKKEGVDAAVINGVVPLRFSPKVAVNHGIDTLKVTRLYLHAARLLYRTYDATICVSNKLKEEVEKKLGISCAVIPLPLKLETYRPAKPEDRDDVVVHIGTRPVKNPQISIEAIKSLRRRGLPIKLVIVGAPTTVPKEDGIEERFSVSEKEKLDLLCRAKALILPSSYEALPYVVLEAMACGTPPVVSTAVPEEVVIDGYNGLRVHGLDPRDYAAALERLLTDQELWLKLSRNGREFVKQFNYIEIANKYINLIKNLYGR